VQAFIDSVSRVFGFRASVAGVSQGASWPLPAGFDTSAWHTIRIGKSADRVFSFYLDGTMFNRRWIALDHGQAGAFASRADGRFRTLSYRTRAMDGECAGRYRPGSGEFQSLNYGSGYFKGVWDIAVADSPVSAGSGRGVANNLSEQSGFWRLFGAVEALPDSARDASPDAGYGLVVCHDDRDNQLTLWMSMSGDSVALVSVIRGTYQKQ